MLAALVLLLLDVQVAGVLQDRATSPAPCRNATASLYCADLVAVPALRNASGRLDIVPVPSPFGGAVTAAGAPRFGITLTVAGLPAPGQLGPYQVYVAWATTVSLDREIRLGVVRDGTSALGEIALAQFRILVTAEASADVT